MVYGKEGVFDADRLIDLLRALEVPRIFLDRGRKTAGWLFVFVRFFCMSFKQRFLGSFYGIGIQPDLVAIS